MDPQSKNPTNDLSWTPSFLDAITPDCATSNLPWHLTPIGRLPNELLDCVATNFPEPEIAKLTQVSSRFRGVAEERLYGLSGPQNLDSPGKIINFRRTLLARTDLAQKVKKIVLYLQDQMCSLDVPVEACLLSGPRPFQGTVKAEVPDSIIASDILHMLPSLEVLSLHVSNIFNGSGNYPGPTAVLFGETLTHESAWGKLCRVPGFKNLTTLYYNGPGPHWSLGNLPCLEYFHVGYECDFSVDQGPAGIGKATSLSVNVDLSILDRQLGCYQGIGPFLDHFPHAQELTVEISDYGSWSQVNSEDTARFSALIARICTVQSSLQRLVITIDEGLYFDMTYGNYPIKFLPTKLLQKFTSLRFLTVPFEALQAMENRDEHVEMLDFVPLFESLPESIEVLELKCASLLVWKWLQGFVDERKGRCPFLREIKLHCMSLYGDDYEKFAYTKHMYPVYNQLGALGISITIHCPDGHFLPEWKDPCYDPLVNDTVEFIGSLTDIPSDGKCFLVLVCTFAHQ